MRPPHPAQPKPRRAGSFSLRLAVSLIVTVAVVGVTQYVLAARQLTQRVVEQAATAHEGDARVLRGLAGHGDDWKPVSELLGHIAARPGVSEVAVVGPNSRVAAVGMRHTAPKHGMKMKMDMEMKPRSGAFEHGALVDLERRAIVDRAILDDRTQATEDPTRAGRRVYAVPVNLAAGRHVLVVTKVDRALRGQLSDMRWILLLTLGGGVLLALPMFYVLGGRTLSARYALERHRSSKDALTGLGNHRSFHEDLRRQVEIAQRRGGTVSLALVDVDNFKQVNDTAGHAEGDAVLMHIARLLSSGRAEDAAYRVGGDEFALLLPGTSVEDAEIVLERIRCRVAEQCTVATTSIGVAEIGRPAGDAESLLACADMALYQAKDAGRNRVCPAAPPSERVAH